MSTPKVTASTSKPTATGSQKSKSQPQTTDSKYKKEEGKKKKICREHSYCYKPSNPSCYPIGLPWASEKLKCLPGYCDSNETRCTARQKSGTEGRKKKKERFIKTLVDEDDATKEELYFLLKIATMAGDYDDDMKGKMEILRTQLKRYSGEESSKTLSVNSGSSSKE